MTLEEYLRWQLDLEGKIGPIPQGGYPDLGPLPERKCTVEEQEAWRKEQERRRKAGWAPRHSEVSKGIPRTGTRGA